MSKIKTCSCGALSCQKCYPQNYKLNLLYDRWVEENKDISFEEWVNELTRDETEYKIESLKGKNMEVLNEEIHS